MTEDGNVQTLTGPWGRTQIYLQKFCLVLQLEKEEYSMIKAKFMREKKSNL